MTTPAVLNTIDLDLDGLNKTTSTTTHGVPEADKQNDGQHSSSKRRLGKQEAERLAGPGLVENLEKLDRVNPALGQSLIENGFGSNISLGYREWAMVTIATLVATGDTTDQMQAYLQNALKHGATEKEIIDLINLTSSFTGVPRPADSIRQVNETLFGGRESHLWNVQETVVSLHDHSTIVRDSHGYGIPAVLIHGLSMDRHMWRAVFPRLAAGGRVVSYDLRGHGQASDAPLTKDLNQLADDLKELLDILSVDKVDVYGVSYGGAVAQYFTLAYPRRVRSLVVIASASKGHEMLLGRATRAEADGVESLVGESITRWFLPETIARDEWMVRYARACHSRASVENWAAAWRAMAALDCLDRLGTIQVPVLVLAGAQDISTPPSIMKYTYEGCKDGEYRELNPGTHLMVMEQAEAASAELIGFRSRVNAKNHQSVGKPLED